MKTLKQQLSKGSVAGVLSTPPFAIGLLLFMLVPMGILLYYPFYDYDILSPPVFTGLKNFISMPQDETFLKTLKVTFFFVFVSIPLKLLFALIMAMLLLGNSKMSGSYRATYYLPSIIGGSAAASTPWKRMFVMDGVVSKLLGMAEIQTSFSWLGDTRTAIWVLIPLVVWQFGSSMLIFPSSLKQILQSLYEAAEVDDVSASAKFFKITLPLLIPTIFFDLVIQMTNGFPAFTQCYIITQGEPMNSTLLYTVYMYKQSSEFYNTGYDAALTWVMLAMIGLTTLFLFATKQFRVYEGGL